MANSAESARGIGHFKIATFSRLTGMYSIRLKNTCSLNNFLLYVVSSRLSSISANQCWPILAFSFQYLYTANTYSGITLETGHVEKMYAVHMYKYLPFTL